jgi:hypothetical protein
MHAHRAVAARAPLIRGAALCNNSPQGTATIARTVRTLLRDRRRARGWGCLARRGRRRTRLVAVTAGRRYLAMRALRVYVSRCGVLRDVYTAEQQACRRGRGWRACRRVAPLSATNGGRSLSWARVSPLWLASISGYFWRAFDLRPCLFTSTCCCWIAVCLLPLIDAVILP